MKREDLVEMIDNKLHSMSTEHTLLGGLFFKLSHRKELAENIASFIEEREKELTGNIIELIKGRKLEYPEKRLEHAAIRGVLDYVIADIECSFLSSLTKSEAADDKTGELK